MNQVLENLGGRKVQHELCAAWIAEGHQDEMWEVCDNVLILQHNLPPV